MSEPQLVLSCFPGIGLLDAAFELEDFCVVRGPDLLWGGDVHRFHPPVGRFDGVIGGPPCQAFSTLRHLVLANGHALAPNLIPEYERCVAEAAPTWFLMENVPGAPEPAVPGYVVRSLLLDNRQAPAEPGSPLGAEQRRVRRFSFGTRDGRVLRPRVALFEAPRSTLAVLASAGGRARPMRLGGSGKPKWGGRIAKQADVLAPIGAVTANCTVWDPGRNGPMSSRTEAAFREACRLQGLPPGFDLPPFTVAGKIKAVGNGVPLPLGRAIARAVLEALI